MNRSSTTSRPRQAVEIRLRMLAAALFLLAIVAPTGLAQSPPGGTDPNTPASETQHSNNVEEATEPAAENPSLPPTQETLARRIFNELISPCCWTTTVAQHGSGAAPRIQAEVRRMIAAGMGHQAIIDRYVQEYGERILASPRKKGFNMAVYLVPPFGLAVGALFIAMAYRRRGKGRQPAMAAARAGTFPAGAGKTPAPQPRPTPGSEEDYRRRIEEEIRRSS